ncbi:MAG: arylsulfotransferase family protein, partial [Myxococcota bacterium]
LQWARFNRAHHDLAVVPDGDIYVLTRGARLAPEVDRDSPILEDFISILDPDGVEKRRISLLEVFESSAEQHSWRRASRDFWSKEAIRGLVRQGGHGDLFHTNALEVLDGRPPLPGFEAGHLLLSFRNLDRIAVIDPESEQVMWSLDARTSMQHDPSVTPEGGVLVFDNHWRPGERSRVVLLDPRDGSVMWQYHGPDEAPLYSETCGSAVRLANGNVLITESDNGHALEVTGEGEVVWDFYNPQVAGKNAEFIATLFDLVRLPPDFPVDWAQGAADGLGE